MEFRSSDVPSGRHLRCPGGARPEVLGRQNGWEVIPWEMAPIVNFEFLIVKMRLSVL